MCRTLVLLSLMDLVIFPWRRERRAITFLLQISHLIMGLCDSYPLPTQDSRKISKQLPHFRISEVSESQSVESRVSLSGFGIMAQKIRR